MTFPSTTPVTKKSFSDYSKAQQNNMRVYSYRNLILNTLRSLSSIPLDEYPPLANIFTQEQLTIIKDIRKEVRTKVSLSSHNFTICPTCNKALTGRKIRKDNKQATFEGCAICDKATDFNTLFANRLIRSKYSLSEAREHIATNFPELLL